MNSPAEIAALAKGLTKAQIKRLLNIHTLNERGLMWSSALGDRRLHTSRATSRALLDLGLIQAMPMTDIAVLTHLGLAVRTHLLGDQSRG